MAKASTNFDNNRTSLIIIVRIIDVQKRKLSVVFQGYVIKKYNCYDVPRSGFQYIYCDLIDLFKYLIITFFFSILLL